MSWGPGRWCDRAAIGRFVIDDRVLPVQLGAVAAAVWCRDRVSRTGRRSASRTHPVSGRPPPLGRGVPRPTRPASGGRRGRCRGAAGAAGPVGGGGLADPSGDCSEPPAGQEGVSPSIRTTRVRRTAAEVVGAVGHGSALRGITPERRYSWWIRPGQPTPRSIPSATLRNLRNASKARLKSIPAEPIAGHLSVEFVFLFHPPPVGFIRRGTPNVSHFLGFLEELFEQSTK